MSARVLTRAAKMRNVKICTALLRAPALKASAKIQQISALTITNASYGDKKNKQLKINNYKFLF